MKFRIILSILAVVFLSILIFSRATSPSSSTNSKIVNYSELVGKPAPNFELPSYDGTTVALSSFLGKKVVLFFNEGIMCYPACWNQIAALGTDKDLNNDQVATASIVPDKKDEWVTAINRQPDLGSETLLFDSDTNVSREYGMMSIESSMHKGSKPGHTYVIIDEKGIVRYAYDDPSMGIQNDLIKQELGNL